MNWQQLLILAIILAVVFFSVWRSSSKKTGCGCGCGHDHHSADNKKENTAAR